MFPSKVAIYNDNRLLGTSATTAQSNFDTSHPLYTLIGDLARLRTATPALRRGKQVTRALSQQPGLFAASRFDPVTGQEVLLVFNTSTAPISANVTVEVDSLAFKALAGSCAPTASAPGSVKVALPALGFAVCAAQ
jgi:hypothetical protein